MQTQQEQKTLNLSLVRIQHQFTAPAIAYPSAKDIHSHKQLTHRIEKSPY